MKETNVAVLFRSQRHHAPSSNRTADGHRETNDMSSGPSRQGGFRKFIKNFGRRPRDNFGPSSPLPSLATSQLSQGLPEITTEPGPTTILQQTLTKPALLTGNTKDSGYVAWAGLEAALRALKKSSDVFPPLGYAVGGLLECLDIFEVIIFIAL
jgi:hypothetical protein